ncbi:MAG: DinB family protein [Spirosomaceae bacterium]|nr:DinB family protein [Spirosomataceae bacterium]
MESTLPPFYDRYISLCNTVSLKNSFEKFAVDTVLDASKLEALGDLVYAQNKWTAKQVLQHCIDTERIMSYRALRFSRNDKTALPGFDEDRYANEASVSERSLENLMEEFLLVRQTTVILFSSLSEESLQRKGTASGIEISVEQLGYMLIGHLLHHQSIFSERYYPLINS